MHRIILWEQKYNLNMEDIHSSAHDLDVVGTKVLILFPKHPNHCVQKL